MKLTAWRIVAVLGVLLACSVAINLRQWRNAATAKAEARAEVLDETLKTTAGIARQAQADHKELLADLVFVVERGRTERTVYRQAAAQRPLPVNCAPGAERVDAVNAGLGPRRR